MCAPSAPKAPAPAPKKDPRILLSRSQYDDLLLSPVAFGSGNSGSGGGGGGPSFGGLGFSTNGSPAAGLRIPR